jgi:prepilin-type N-terminal cleavage/methylation domain-containing protein
MKNIRKKNKLAGFSLIELIVAMAMAVVITLAATAAFGGMVKARNTVRNEQQDLENARNVMDTMAKQFRMSSDDAVGKNVSSGDTVAFYDDASQTCLSYTFDTSSKSIEQAQMTPPPSAAGTNYLCDNNNNIYNLYSYYSNYQPFTSSNSGGLTLGNIPGLTSLQFFMPANDPDPTTSVGRVTILMIVDGQSLETTVSFRNYPQS